MNVILASASPRRLALLGELGLSPLVQPADIDETPRHDERPDMLVERLALEKAHAISATTSDLVIAADTIVVHGETILGKPTNEVEATSFLRLLAGGSHRVMSGVAVLYNNLVQSCVETTHVTMAPLSDGQIDWYVATGEPSDKAGAYALQGIAGAFVERIEGSFDNVIGLPRHRLLQLCSMLGVDLLVGGTSSPTDTAD